ncbi:hypothetical protein ACHAW6_005348 [Cyclotella cf. meneghiniana]
MVTTGTKHALQCSDFTEAWKEWNRRVNIQKTWPNWKNHWTQAFNENRAIQRLTGNIFCANTTIEDELSEKMNDTIKKVIDINKQQQETIHNLQSQNGELLALLKHLSGSSIPDVSSKKTRQLSTLWDPTGYCWTHGYKVKKGHTSKTCKTHGGGHQENATCSNTMDGRKTNKH